MKATIAVVLVTLEGAAAIYVALVGWLFSGWMVDDSLAFRMDPSDWYVAAFQRAVIACGCGIAFGAVVYPVNRRWVAPAIPSRPRIAFGLSALFATLIAMAGIAGSVEFAIRKPFM